MYEHPSTQDATYYCTTFHLIINDHPIMEPFSLRLQNGVRNDKRWLFM